MTRITEWKKEALPEGLTHIMGDKEEKVQGGRNRRKERRGEERKTITRREERAGKVRYIDGRKVIQS